jgi:hypothetical protein
MSLLADDGQIKATWLLDRLGRRQTEQIVTHPVPATTLKFVPKQDTIPNSFVQSSEPLPVPVPDLAPQSQVRETSDVDDIFCFSDSDTAYQQETWSVFLSEITRRATLV